MILDCKITKLKRQWSLELPQVCEGLIGDPRAGDKGWTRAKRVPKNFITKNASIRLGTPLTGARKDSAAELKVWKGF